MDTALNDLPDECILSALAFLKLRDALSFCKSCRKFNLLLKYSQNHFWLPRLRSDFGLHVLVRLILDMPHVLHLLLTRRAASNLAISLVVVPDEPASDCVRVCAECGPLSRRGVLQIIRAGSAPAGRMPRALRSHVHNRRRRHAAAPVRGRQHVRILTNAIAPKTSECRIGPSKRVPEGRFAPNNWEFYCSAGVANVNSIGMVMVRIVHFCFAKRWVCA